MLPPIRRLLAVALVAATAFVGLVAGPAQASPEPSTAALAGSVPGDCQGLDLTDRDAFTARAELAHEIFVGRVLQVRAFSPGTPGNPMRVVEYAVLVDDVLKGDLTVGTGIQVVVGWPRSEKVVPLDKEETYLFFVRRQGDQLLAERCEGTQLLPDGLGEGQRETLMEFLNPGEAPQSVVLSRPDDGAGEPPRLSRVLAPGAAITLFGLLGLVVVVRLSRVRAG